MSIIRECGYCLPEVNDKRSYRKQTEVYDAIGIDVPMCWNCGEAALFERERIIKLLESGSCGHYCRCINNELCDVYAEAIALIKGKK